MEEKSNTINGTQFDDFYSKGKIYWETIEPTVDGMLGGFTQVTNVDIQASTRLLGEYFPLIDNPKHKPKFGCNRQTKDTRALDCGAGIGRVIISTFECKFKSFFISSCCLVAPIIFFFLFSGS